MLQSRPLSATAWPCLSPTICTSRCRALEHNCMRNMGEPARGSSVSLLLRAGAASRRWRWRGTPPRAWNFVRHLHEVVSKFRSIFTHADALAAAALARFQHDGVADALRRRNTLFLGRDHGLCGRGLGRDRARLDDHFRVDKSSRPITRPGDRRHAAVCARIDAAILSPEPASDRRTGR